MIWQPATAVSHRSSRYVLDNSYTVLRLEPDTKTMTPLFAIPQSTGVLVYRSRPQPQQRSQNKSLSSNVLPARAAEFHATFSLSDSASFLYHRDAFYYGGTVCSGINCSCLLAIPLPSDSRDTSGSSNASVPVAQPQRLVCSSTDPQFPSHPAVRGGGIGCSCWIRRKLVCISQSRMHSLPTVLFPTGDCSGRLTVCPTPMLATVTTHSQGAC